jgi:hypothetical protein
MKTSSLKVVTVILAALILGASTVYAAGVTARVSGVKGKVEVQKGTAWSAVKNGDSVSAGMKLRTGSDGSCMVTWGGGHGMKVTPLTTITVDQLERNGDKETSSFNLGGGKVLAKAGKMTGGSSFHVKTPTAVAGVRGTEFAVGLENNVSSVQVVDGQVEVGAPGVEPVIIDPGYMVTMPEGTTIVPPPEPIPPVQLQELQQGMQEVTTSSDASTQEPPKETPKTETAETETPAAGETTPPEVNTDAALNAVDSTIENNAVQDITTNAGSPVITGTVDVEITIGQPR